MKANSKKSVISRFRQFLSSNWWSLRRRIGTGAAWVWDYWAQIVIALVGGALVIAFVSVVFSECAAGIVGGWFGTNTKKDTLEFLGLGISGVIAFYGLLVFNRRAAAQDKANELTEKGHAQERFKTAVDHLSNRESKTARIASFYELYYLAKDNQDTKDGYAQTVLDILCAHLRHITNPKTSTGETTEEADTLIGILFERPTANVFHQLHFNLQRVHLPGIDFRYKLPPKNVDFRYANLSKAIFSEEEDLESANFMGANLRNIELQEANLLCANFMDADLQDANLLGATLHFANLQKAKLWNADLQSASLLAAELCNAVLHDADLRGADFSDADLENADFSNAYLQGANLSSAKNFETAIFAGVTDNEETKYPS